VYREQYICLCVIFVVMSLNLNGLIRFYHFTVHVCYKRYLHGCIKIEYMIRLRIKCEATKHDIFMGVLKIEYMTRIRIKCEAMKCESSNHASMSKTNLCMLISNQRVNLIYFATGYAHKMITKCHYLPMSFNLCIEK